MRVRAIFLVVDDDGIERAQTRHFDLDTGDEIHGHVSIPPHGHAEHTHWLDAIWAVKFHA
jgi:transcription termination factor Rho